VPADGELPLTSLSGGNQQKVVLGRWIRRDPRIVLIDQPTQGVDVGARAMLLSLLKKSAADGTALLVFSPETDELAQLCDRVLVMNRGRIVAELAGEKVTERAILSEILEPRVEAHA
jgi:ribose transport system ATP-binding protein